MIRDARGRNFCETFCNQLPVALIELRWKHQLPFMRLFTLAQG